MDANCRILRLHWDSKGETWVSLKVQGKGDLPNSMEAFQYFYNQFGKKVALELHHENLVQRIRKEYSRQREGQV